jgi:hypothetical protein
MKTIIKTSKGDVHAELIELEHHDALQLNVFYSPNGGVGFFLMFPRGKDKEIINAARSLIESNETLMPDIDITHKFDECLLACTAPKMKFNVKKTFGKPTISHQKASNNG